MWEDDDFNDVNDLEDNFTLYTPVQEDHFTDYGKYVLHIMNKHGDIEDTIIGLKDILKYLEEVDK